MKLLPIRQAESLLMHFAKDASDGEVSAFTAKKDRSVTIRKTPDQAIITEDGFEQKTITLDASDKSGIRKTLREIMDREFPRSHKIYCT